MRGRCGGRLYAQVIPHLAQSERTKFHKPAPNGVKPMSTICCRRRSAASKVPAIPRAQADKVHLSVTFTQDKASSDPLA